MYRTYEVQTLRLSMNSFEEWTKPNETVENVKELVKLLDQLNIEFFNIGIFVLIYKEHIHNLYI